MAMQPFTLTDEQKAEVETPAAVLTAEQVADYFGIGRRTFYSMMQREEEIAAPYKRGKANSIGVIAQEPINKARAGDTTSMIFFLKTQVGWRETSRVEHAACQARHLARLSLPEAYGLSQCHRLPHSRRITDRRASACTHRSCWRCGWLTDYPAPPRSSRR